MPYSKIKEANLMAASGYPLAPQRPASWQCGSHSVTDPYLYMTNAQDPGLLDWVAAENAFTDAWFQSTALQERIRFLKSKPAYPHYSGLTEQDGRIYATRTGPGGEYSTVLLDLDFHEVATLLDGAMMDGQMQVYGVYPCPGDSRIAAFTALKNGAPRMTVIVRDLEAGETLAEMDGTFFFSWSDNGAYAYSSTAVQRPDGTTANSVIRWCRATGHVETVYTWPGHAVFLQLGAAPGGGMFVQVCQNYHDSVMVYLDADGNAFPVFPENGAETTYLGTIGTRHYFFTDENAPMGKIVAVEHSALGGPACEIVPESSLPLEGAGVVGSRLLLVYLEDVACSAKVYDADGAFLRELALPTPMGTVACSKPMSGAVRGTDTIYLSFESFTCPPCILRCDAATGEVRSVYGSGLEPRGDLAVERRFVTARDGQRILAFLVYKKGLEPTGDVPTLMYGYGGYASSQLPWYNNPFVGLDIPDWADRGGLYVHCILRGGAEYGAAWHDAGCGLHKKNVFFDFIDIARTVMADGWTDPAHTAICGGSNGGLLVTALMTMAPELWGCVIASVPHTDMLHFCCDDRGPMYVTEYGDPRTEEFFEYMKSYSPYHNIRPGTSYPAAYIQTGERDNNVPPYHGKKFAAAMQQVSAGGPVLLRVLPYGSHDRGAGEYCYRTTAEMQIFMERALGMTP